MTYFLISVNGNHDNRGHLGFSYNFSIPNLTLIMTINENHAKNLILIPF